MCIVIKITYSSSYRCVCIAQLQRKDWYQLMMFHWSFLLCKIKYKDNMQHAPVNLEHASDFRIVQCWEVKLFPLDPSQETGHVRHSWLEGYAYVQLDHSPVHGPVHSPWSRFTPSCLLDGSTLLIGHIENKKVIRKGEQRVHKTEPSTLLCWSKLSSPLFCACKNSISRRKAVVYGIQAFWIILI